MKLKFSLTFKIRSTKSIPRAQKIVNKCFINVSKKRSVYTVKVIRINDANKNKL